MIIFKKNISNRAIGALFSSPLILTSVQFACLAQNNKSSSIASTNNSVNGNKGKAPLLYGRIEQIAGQAGAQFPVLKEQTAKLDTRQLSKTTKDGRLNTFTGSLVRSFPQQFNGTWGGHLKIWTSQMDAICWQLDSEEANRTRQLLTPGREGSVNFNFEQAAGGQIDLEPAQVIFLVPMKDTHMQEELNSMLGAGGLGQAGGLTLPGMDSRQMASAMQQMANNMTVPIMVNFGNINRSDVEGISGNEIKASVLSNAIRQLSPSILEEQIVTLESQRNKRTGKVRQEYAETVMRFTNQDANTLYVQAAAVNYTADRKFERKLILYGIVRRGQVMQDSMNPMSGFTNLIPGSDQLPKLPAGQNPFQGLLPH